MLLLDPTKASAKDIEEQRSELLREAQLMREIPPHPHIVSLVGVCLPEDPWLVVTEFCEFGEEAEVGLMGGTEHGDLCAYMLLLHSGDLRTFMRSLATSGIEENVSVCERIMMARQVAKGMAFLHECGIVHRDLAARNCLVTTQTQIKVGVVGGRCTHHTRRDPQYLCVFFVVHLCVLCRSLTLACRGD